jgi:hypothetical protein
LAAFEVITGDIPLGGSYDLTRDCEPPRSCVVVKIDEFTRVLTDKSKSRDERTTPSGSCSHANRNSPSLSASM